MFEPKNKYFIITLQILSVIAIVVSQIDILLKIALFFCYIFLFRQKKWYRHLLIMFIMLLMLAVASNGFI